MLQRLASRGSFSSRIKQRKQRLSSLLTQDHRPSESIVRCANHFLAAASSSSSSSEFKSQSPQIPVRNRKISHSLFSTSPATIVPPQDGTPSTSETKTARNNGNGSNSNKVKKRRRPSFTSTGRKRRSNKLKVTKYTLERLFDDVMPRLTFKEMRDLVTLFKNAQKLAPAAKGSYDTRVRFVFQSIQTKYTKTTAPQWLQKRMKQLLLGERPKDESGFQGDADSDHRSNTSDTSSLNNNNNNNNNNNDVDILMRVRENLLRSEADTDVYLWSNSQMKLFKKELGKGDALASFQQKLKAQVLPRRQQAHAEKTSNQLEEEARDLVCYLTTNFPKAQFRTWLDDFRESLPSNGQKRRSGMKTLVSKLFKAFDNHCFRAAHMVADFLYLERENEEHEVLRKAEKRWQELRERFVERTMELQEAMMTQKTKKEAEQDVLQKAMQEVDVKLIETAQRQANDDKQTPRAITKKKTKYHVRLDAMFLTDKEVSVPYHDRMIFVDNLPIDMTETDLFDLYSRCGPLQAIQMFNQRLDLDPGPLSANQLRERNKLIRRNRSNTVTNKRWQRPRTPLYALLTFGTDDAFRVATQDAMQLFGMVVRGHAMRTVRANTLSNLYVESLPSGLHTADLEYYLAKILKQEDIYVCLDLGQHTSSEPTSCEIRFPSFESAFQSYNKLVEGVELDFRKDDEESEPVRVNWMRTPQDAHLYWTRKLGFD